MAKKKIIGKGFGARYGKKLRENYANIEDKQRKKQKCPFCSSLAAKRLSKGIFICNYCGKKFASRAYYVK
jgi:large subunit ribosomal protein L37Ae